MIAAVSLAGPCPGNGNGTRTESMQGFVSPAFAMCPLSTFSKGRKLQIPSRLFSHDSEIEIIKLGVFVQP